MSDKQDEFWFSVGKWVLTLAVIAISSFFAITYEIKSYDQKNFTQDEKINNHETRIVCLEKVYNQMAIDMGEMKTDLRWIAESMGKHKRSQ